MSNVLIIGNGFDLYHKLPTRYTDFLFFVNNWSDFCSKHENASIEVTDTDMLEIKLSDYGELTKKSIDDFAKYKNAYSEEYIDEFNLVHNNKWIDYFNEVIASSQLGKNWIDFEQEILNALLYVQQYFEVLPTIAGTNQVINNVTSVEIHRVIRIFAEKSPGTFAPNFGLIHKSDLRNIDEKKQWLISFMRDELDKLNTSLNIYLLEFVTRIKCGLYSEQISNLTGIELLNFNYTYTYKNIYGGRKLKHHHPIHGDAQEHNMVLGIPDESFPNTTEYIYFQKYFQRIQKRTGSFYREWITEPAHRCLEDVPAEVYIMGHSLAETDKGILKDIFLNRYVSKITIFYHSQNAYEDMVINLVKMFGKDFVIENTASYRIVFEELKPPVVGAAK